MLLKRIMSLVIGFIVTIFIIVFTNQYVVNLTISIFIFIAIREMDRAFRNKNIKPISIISYITTIFIFTLNNLVYLGYLSNLKISIEQIYLYIVIPVFLLLLFLVYVFKHNKYTIMDVGITILQLIYSVFLFNFITSIYSLENGKIYIWYIFIGSWFTDIFAFCIGKTIGKHHFTQISPKKTIEGSIGGIIGAVLSYGIFTYVLNTCFKMNIGYIGILVLAVICSIISQIGDLFASSIKRYVGIKDYGNILPGHGGIIDRFDSTIFVAPIVFMYFYLLF